MGKRVMFRTPSPNKETLKTKTETKKQVKPVQEVTKKPFPTLDKASKEMNVKDLDLSKPPPSLHSNIRPPKLVSSSGIGNSSSSEAEPPDTSAIYFKQATTSRDSSSASVMPGINPISPTDPALSPILNQFSSFGNNQNQNMGLASFNNLDQANLQHGLQNVGTHQFSPLDQHDGRGATDVFQRPVVQDLPLFQPLT